MQVSPKEGSYPVRGTALSSATTLLFHGIWVVVPFSAIVPISPAADTLLSSAPLALNMCSRRFGPVTLFNLNLLHVGISHFNNILFLAIKESGYFLKRRVPRFHHLSPCEPDLKQ